MFARHVAYNLKPNLREEFKKTFEKEVLPLLQKQNGFTDEITLVSPDGKNCIAISVWDKKEKAEAYAREAYPQVLKALAKMIDGTPEVHGYEVTTSTFPKFATAH